MIIRDHQIKVDEEKNTTTVTEFHNGKKRKTVLDRFTFVERYLEHVPPKGVVTIRNYGLYSNKYKEKLAEVRLEEFGQTQEIEDYEETCPKCHNILEVRSSFSPVDEFPLILKLYLKKYEDPPEHGKELNIA